MVEIWSSLPLLKQELKDTLETLVISGRKDIKFKYRTTKESNNATIRESTGRPRLFQFGDTIINSYQYVGGGSVGIEGRWIKLDVPPLREDLESGWQLITFMVYCITDET